MAFPDSSKKAPNVFLDVADSTRSAPPVTVPIQPVPATPPQPQPPPA